VTRLKLPRETSEVETKWGKVRVKISGAKGQKPTTITPEYEDCRQIATTNGVALRAVIEEARNAAREQLK
jgi:uncharacterized protein (DUF111 family)